MSEKSEFLRPGFPVLKHLTPVLVVGSVVDCLQFWIDRLGFQMTASVPGKGHSLIFAILKRGDVEIMYQSRESALADGTMTEADAAGHSVALYLEVDSIDDVERAIGGTPIVKARHQTFYGTTEIYVKEPGGNTVGFSQSA
ncbi:MAG: VOC family protein [Gemmatimonadaceae bacterium]|nr:VOC family protein [Gemmatimonadaceae bacterium]